MTTQHTPGPSIYQLGAQGLYEMFRHSKAEQGLSFPVEWAALSAANQRVWIGMARGVMACAKANVAAIAKATGSAA